MEYATAIKGGTLDLICPEMELLVCPSYDQIALKGVGAIRSDNLGRLYFRMISPFLGAAPHRSLLGSKLAGEVYSLEDCVILRAIDETGREWRSNPLTVDLSNEIPLPNYHVRKHTSNILHSREGSRTEHSSVRILIPGAPSLPFDMVTQDRRSVGGREIGYSSSIDRHEHHIGGAIVTFRHEEEGFLSVSATQSGAFEPTWPELMCHALRFATGQTILPVVITRELKGREDLGLHSGPFWRYSSLIPPPVYFRGREGAGNFWRVVELFFNHIEKHQFEPYPLLDELEGIRRGAQGSFQTACLTLGVGIESIAKLLLKDELVSPPSIRPLLDHLELWQGDAALKKRAQGALSRLSDVSTADLMYAWAKRTGISGELLDGWKKLRNPKAHGETVTEEGPGWSLYCSAVELLHRMVAYAIGYDGPILETSHLGWGLEKPGAPLFLS